jgi:MOSC domain-containing protein YiiM
VEGLADDEVCIGDRYQIGGAVFEVTQLSRRDPHE